MRPQGLAVALAAATGCFIAAPGPAQGATPASSALHTEGIEQLTGAKGQLDQKEGVAIHQHMTGEQPRILFLHYWGTGAAQDLARGLRSALDRTATRLGAR